jgi:hypothetical protein
LDRGWLRESGAEIDPISRENHRLALANAEHPYLIARELERPGIVDLKDFAGAEIQIDGRGLTPPMTCASRETLGLTFGQKPLQTCSLVDGRGPGFDHRLF